MTISAQIIENAAAQAKGRIVSDVRLGLGYSAVQLDDDSVGAAYTFRDAFSGGCSVFHGKLPLNGQPADEIIPLIDSTDLLEATVGSAAVNALTNRHRAGQSNGDVLDALDIKPEDRVGMVGYFAPMMNRLSSMASEIYIFEKMERSIKPWEKVYPSEDAPRLMPECQVALLTATALVNHTMDDLLEAVSSCREVVVLGSSTPLCREAFDDTPVTLLSGMIVDSPADVLTVVSQGGGTRQFKGLVSKVNERIKPSRM